MTCVTCDMWHIMCQMSHVTCHVSHVTCHVSHVTCHMSCVTCNTFFSSFWQCGEAYWWRVCYQRGLSRPVHSLSLKTVLLKCILITYAFCCDKNFDKCYALCGGKLFLLKSCWCTILNIFKVLLYINLNLQTFVVDYTFWLLDWNGRIRVAHIFL